MCWTAEPKKGECFFLLLYYITNFISMQQQFQYGRKVKLIQSKTFSKMEKNGLTQKSVKLSNHSREKDPNKRFVFQLTTEISAPQSMWRGVQSGNFKQPVIPGCHKNPKKFAPSAKIGSNICNNNDVML